MAKTKPHSKPIVVSASVSSEDHLGLRASVASSSVHLQVVLDDLAASRIECADEHGHFFARSVVHGTHPRKRHKRNAGARKVPVVPLDAVLVHSVRAALE